MDELHDKSQLISQVEGDDDDDEPLELGHWGLAKLSNLLHEASMEVAELARRRQFEDELAKQLNDELHKERPLQNQIILGLQRYDRWTKAHQRDICRRHAGKD